MQMLCKLSLIIAAALLANCQSRGHLSRISGAESSASTFKGRVAVFNIYNKTTQSTRLAPGIMVSSRGVVISGMQADETLSLADDQRKGEKYIPIPSTQNGTFFVGLAGKRPLVKFSAPAPSDKVNKQAGLSLAPVTADTLPPLSAQPLEPLAMIPQSLSNTQVIMYNDMGYVFARATTHNNGRIIRLRDIGRPHRYPSPKYFGPFQPGDGSTPGHQFTELNNEAGIKMLRKGGPIVELDDKIYEGGIWHVDGTWSLGGPKQADTIDIIGFMVEDPSLSDLVYPPQTLTRNNVLPREIAASVEAVSVNFKVPSELNREIMPYLDCDF